MHKQILPIADVDRETPLIILKEDADWTFTLEWTILHELGHAKYTKHDLKTLMLLILQKAWQTNVYHARAIQKFFEAVPWDLPKDHPLKAFVAEARAEKFMFDNASDPGKIASLWRELISERLDQVVSTSRFVDLALSFASIIALELISGTELCDKKPFYEKSKKAAEIGEKMGNYAYQGDWVSFLQAYVNAWGKTYNVENTEKLANVLSNYANEIVRDGADEFESLIPNET